MKQLFNRKEPIFNLYIRLAGIGQEAVEYISE
jgi:hypothetical protein